ncbi:MAG: hypothetical protein CNLJKLNK_01423 [Holosporales bacterium]
MDLVLCYSRKKMKKTIILTILTFSACCVDASSMRRFMHLSSSFMVSSVATRFVSMENGQRIYTEDDFVKFPDIPSLKSLIRDDSPVFVPPHGPHYSHPRYNMNIYQRGLEVLKPDVLKDVLNNSKRERYIFPDRNSPQLVDRFSNLPFSAVGSLWAYLSEDDYINDTPCWSGSASLIAPYAALTAAHCILSDDSTRNPAIYSFVLHHFGSTYTKKVKCLGTKVSNDWERSIKNRILPSHLEDYGLVYFDSIDEKHEVLKIKRIVEDLSGKTISVNGYPGDSTELRAHKLWPSHLDRPIVRPVFSLLNRMPYFIRKGAYTTLNRFGYLQDDKYAGCFMYTSSGKVIREEGGIICYDANTFSGQSGGNGVSELLIKSDQDITRKTTLDFIHTLGGSIDTGNKGLKIDGSKTEAILQWSDEIRELVEKRTTQKKEEEDIIKERLRKEGVADEQERRIKKMIIKGKFNEDILEIFENFTNEELDKIRESMTR